MGRGQQSVTAARTAPWRSGRGGGRKGPGTRKADALNSATAPVKGEGSAQDSTRDAHAQAQEPDIGKAIEAGDARKVLVWNVQDDSHP